MQFYILKCAVNTAETGSTYPQIQKMKSGYNYNSDSSVYAVSRERERLPTYSPDLDYFVMHSKAKLTNIISTSVIDGGFLVSKKVKDILQNFKLPLHDFFPAKVSYKKNIYEDYYWMHTISDLTNKVDYKKSKFFIYLNYSHKLGYIDVTSKEELLRKKSDLKKNNPGKTITIWAESIQLMLPVNFDLFEIGMFDANIYITDKLKDCLVNNNITGISVTEANNIK